MAWFIPALISGVSAVSSYFAGRRKKAPRFGRTAYGQELRRQTKEGAYSPIARRQILGEITKRTGNIAQQARTYLRGRFASRLGTSTSIATERALTEPRREQMRLVGAAGERLTTRNEMSKAYARERYGMLTTQREDVRRAEAGADRQRVAGLIGGLAGAGVQAYAGKKGWLPGQVTERGLDIREKVASARADYYKSQTEPKPSFALPEDFVDFTSGQLVEWAKNAGIPYEQARQIQDDMFAEQIRGYNRR